LDRGKASSQPDEDVPISGEAVPGSTRPKRPSDSAPPPPDVPTLGKFRLLALLGKGGMGEVYLALSHGSADSSKLVVIKRLSPVNALEPSIREMFLDEGRLAVRLNHPNVVQTYEVVAEAGTHLLVMEYLEGQALARLGQGLTDAGRRVPREIALNVVIQALAGLQHAHALTDYDGTRLNVVHRDLSPHNIFITYDGVVKLVDFGIAKAAGNSATTQSGIFKGKPAYMAPEQVMGSVDARADLYTMGAVLWELVAGKRLVKKEDSVKTLTELVQGPPVPRLRTAIPDIPQRLDDIVAKALEKDRELRFASAGEMREALVAYVKESGERAGPDEVGRLMGELFERKRERVRKVIQSYVRNPPAADAIGTSKRSLDTLTFRTIDTGHLAGALDFSSQTDTGSPVDSTKRSSPFSAAIPKGRPWVLVALIVVVAAAAAVVAVSFKQTRKGDASVSSPRVTIPSSPPSDSAAAVETAASASAASGLAASGLASVQPGASTSASAATGNAGSHRLLPRDTSQVQPHASASAQPQLAVATGAPSAPAPQPSSSTPPPKGRVFRTDL
jgi:serine/threonine-protein kinase